MNKTIQWSIWVLALIAINIPTISFASLSLFGTVEGTSIFSVDYLLAAGIVLLGNIIIIHLLLAIRKGYDKAIVYGLITAVAQATGLYLFAVTFSVPWLILSAISILIAIGLLIKVIKSR